MFSWKRPDNLGVKDGRLAPPKAHAQLRFQPGRSRGCGALHRADPVQGRRAPRRWPRCARRWKACARATVIRQEGNYLYAEFRSKLMRFVDDVEFLYDEKAGLLHVRSASRLGRRDFGVNRARVEALRAAHRKPGSDPHPALDYNIRASRPTTEVP